MKDKLHIFTWNLGQFNSSSASDANLHLLANYIDDLGEDAIVYVCEVPKGGLKNNYGPLKVHWPKMIDKKDRRKLGNVNNMHGIFLTTDGVKVTDSLDYPYMIYGRSLSAIFTYKGNVIPCSGFHLPSQMHPTRGQSESARLADLLGLFYSINIGWLKSLDTNIPFHPWSYNHIYMGDFNIRPDSFVMTDYSSMASTYDLERVKASTHELKSKKYFIPKYNPSIDWNGDPKASYFFKNAPLLYYNNLDQIILSSGISRKYISGSFKIHKMLGTTKLVHDFLDTKTNITYEKPNPSHSDHYPIQLTLEL